MRRAVPFTVVVDGERKNLLSAQATVGMALEEAGIELSRHRIGQSRILLRRYVPGMELEVIRVEKEISNGARQASLTRFYGGLISNMLTGQAKTD
jgi:uncharacterized protein YabE (DUF348 family)